MQAGKLLCKLNRSLSLSLLLQLFVYHGWSFVQIVLRTSHKTDSEIQLLPHFAPLKCTMLIMVSSSDETAVWILKVGPIPIDDDLGKEVVTKLTTNLTSNNEFYTDSNGRDFLKRVKRKQSPLLSLIELWGWNVVLVIFHARRFISCHKYIAASHISFAMWKGASKVLHSSVLEGVEGLW